MPLRTGARLGPYDVVSKLGEGGMGEVFRATDSNLKRSVAIKVLPASVAGDPDSLARFQREAELLAALNHPNIAAIYGLEKAPDCTALVMELVDGEDLSQRIARGAIPIDEVLPIARQIAEALETAHEQGIVHRDLKPANIKVRADGTVKVLDFGLAKAMDVGSGPGRSGGPGALSNSPTMMSPAQMSGVGVILGTAAYMAPEQAKGQAVDRRADIWAFGCVVYEMLTGRRAFVGTTVGGVMAAVFAQDPDWSRLPNAAPSGVRRLLRRCLQKDRHHRLKDVGDARIEIEEARTELAAPAQAASTVARPPASARRAWTVTGAVALIAAGTVGWTLRPRQVPLEMRVDIVTPPSPDRLGLALAPDGQKVVFVAMSDGQRRIWLRPVKNATAQPLTGTEGGTYPFWSPDSESIGFFADGKVKRISATGGAAQALADATDGRGGSWNRDNVIIFTPTPSTGIFRVPANGGTVETVTQVEPELTSHRFPQFLSDGRHFLYYGQGGSARRGVYVGTLGEKRVTRLFDSETAAVFAAPGHVLFSRQGALVAQAFDPNRLTISGEPFPVAEQVAFDPTVNRAAISASATGSFVYRTGTAPERQLQWFDRSGAHTGDVGSVDTSGQQNPELSPDGRRVALDRLVNGNRDIWLIDTARGTPSRLTFND